MARMSIHRVEMQADTKYIFLRMKVSSWKEFSSIICGYISQRHDNSFGYGLLGLIVKGLTNIILVPYIHLMLIIGNTIILLI